MNKTIFVQSATILDCAILFPEKGPQGQSWHVDVYWKGSVAEDGVLVDFAEAKKLAKHTIDVAFDHRLFVPQSAIQKRGNNRALILTNWNVNNRLGAFGLDIYENGLVVVGDDVLASLLQGHLEPLENLISESVRKASPQNVGEVSVRLRSPDAGKTHFFSYTHSLRCHEGNCQRFHGHSNVIEVMRAGRLDEALSARAADFLAGKYLVPQVYVCRELRNAGWSDLNAALLERGVHAQSQAFVEYIGSQGPVFLTLPQSVLLPTPDESTIESIADFVKTSLFSNVDVQVVAYEGLQKGALSS
jgi:6-pyruvoyl-tetrahydropterin synthase